MWQASGLWPTNIAKPLINRLLLENSNKAIELSLGTLGMYWYLNGTRTGNTLFVQLLKEARIYGSLFRLLRDLGALIFQYVEYFLGRSSYPQLRLLSYVPPLLFSN
jgi:hypothetical protein